MAYDVFISYSTKNLHIVDWAVKTLHQRGHIAIGPAVQNKTRSKPTSANVFPLRHPSSGFWCARTVLAVKMG